MPRKLDFDALDRAGEGGESRFVEGRRWPGRDPNPTVQMSLRMKAAEYDRFRELCRRERRTNGDMLQVLMESYLAKEEKAK